MVECSFIMFGTRFHSPLEPDTFSARSVMNLAIHCIFTHVECFIADVSFWEICFNTSVRQKPASSARIYQSIVLKRQ